MPVYTFVKESSQYSEEAVALAEAAIQSVLDEGAALDKFKNAARNVGYFAAGAAANAGDSLKASKEKINQKIAQGKGAVNVQKAVADEKAKARKAATDLSKVKARIKVLEDRKKRQKGELLPSEDKELNELYATLFAAEEDA